MDCALGGASRGKMYLIGGPNVAEGICRVLDHPRIIQVEEVCWLLKFIPWHFLTFISRKHFNNWFMRQRVYVEILSTWEVWRARKRSVRVARGAAESNSSLR